MDNQTLETTCCIVGGGPAGIMFAYLIARAGVPVVVLEKHGDFFRDFRGDTVHPSTLEVMDELGLLEDLLKIPHQKVRQGGARFGDFDFQAADFRRLPVHSKFIALMPQWDFLSFLSERAKRFPAFRLMMRYEAFGLTKEGERYTGVSARGPAGETMTIRAQLVVGCDGRRSVVRKAAELELVEFGVPIDVLWFRISRRPDDPQDVLGTANYGTFLILINRGDYFQAGMIIRKGSFEELKSRGLEQFRSSLRRVAPYLGDRVEEIQDWEPIKLLTVRLDRLRRWHRPGLLCIGDAAHAMSPAGGVGINLAIQDAVAAANILSPALRTGSVTERTLALVQRRREFPVRVTQAAQARIHEGLSRIFRNPGPLEAPWQLKAAMRIPGIHVALGYAIGVGVRPEHVAGARRRSALWRPLAFAVGAAFGAAVFVAIVRRRTKAA
jgi:2-polyprenyl-6-methoxyphenol hydroxylase-like FAD-dependent oxidoreductase